MTAADDTSGVLSVRNDAFNEFLNQGSSGVDKIRLRANMNMNFIQTMLEITAFLTHMVAQRQIISKKDLLLCLFHNLDPCKENQKKSFYDCHTIVGGVTFL